MQGRGKGKMPRKEKPEFDQQIVDLARVTRVTKGGKQLSFRATVLIGDHKGRVGYGVDKGKDVQIAVDKSINKAKKNIIHVPIVKDTIPHPVLAKFKSALLMIKPAPRGSGIIAGGALRMVLEMAGVPNASGKILSRSKNKITNIKAAFAALQSFKIKKYQTPRVNAEELVVKQAELEEKKENAADEVKLEQIKQKISRPVKLVKKDIKK